MKIYKNIRLIVATLLFSSVATVATAQGNNRTPQSKIVYDVTFGPTFPIRGESDQINGKLAFSDTTGVLQKVSFDVNLNAFFGQNSDYLSWLANGWMHPDLTFSGSSITFNTDSTITVQGSLGFRDRSSIVKINFKEKKVGAELIFNGNFSMNTSDFFIGPLNPFFIPSQIPFNLTMVFDAPELKKAS